MCEKLRMSAKCAIFTYDLRLDACLWKTYVHASLQMKWKKQKIKYNKELWQTVE